jgi:Protein of unknown function (DUF4058)
LTEQDENAMAMIFPGMDPYLEEPLAWTGFHTALLVYIRDALRPVLRPRYLASVGVRVFVEGPDREISPDVLVRWGQTSGGGTALAIGATEAPVEVQVPEMEIRQPYINIVDLQSQQRVVTVVEVLSPINKYAGPGRDSYLQKQREVRHSQTHLVEIDLLRLGPHVLAVPEWVSRGRYVYDYLICVNRAQLPRDRFQLYPCQLRQRLPFVRIPLADEDPDVRLDLQKVVEQTWEAGDYREVLKYHGPCVPPLPPVDQVWADKLIWEASHSTEQKSSEKGEA